MKQILLKSATSVWNIFRCDEYLRKYKTEILIVQFRNDLQKATTMGVNKYRPLVSTLIFYSFIIE
jgi:hypothetical protein